MAFAADYVPVADRIAAFRERYPDGTLCPANPDRPYEVVTLEGVNRDGELLRDTFIVVVAAAYRSPDDVRPGIGMAMERWPGLTNYTRNSELQNAETSAWGRAIIAVGAADARKGIASAEDVQNRQAEQEVEPPIPGFRTSLLAAIEKLSEAEKQAVKEFMAEHNLPAVKRMTAEQADRVADFIMHGLPKAESDG